jgi:chemotaxis signal transduction protein
MAPESSFCLFRCGSRALAVAVEDVAEIVETDALVRISSCPPRIAGLCPYHRQVVPVVSLEREVEHGARPLAARGRQEGRREAILILHAAQGPWGIRICRDGTTIRRARPDLHEPGRERGAVVRVGSIREGETEFALIDPGATWQALRELVVGWYARFGEAAPAARAGDPGDREAVSGAERAEGSEESRGRRPALPIAQS